jgi:tryptophanyl-tRNA synthetase
MIQFKEKARHSEQVRMSLLTYPILMAADILTGNTGPQMGSLRAVSPTLAAAC